MGTVVAFKKKPHGEDRSVEEEIERQATATFDRCLVKYKAIQGMESGKYLYALYSALLLFEKSIAGILAQQGGSK